MTTRAQKDWFDSQQTWGCGHKITDRPTGRDRVRAMQRMTMTPCPACKTKGVDCIVHQGERDGWQAAQDHLESLPEIIHGGEGETKDLGRACNDVCGLVYGREYEWAIYADWSGQDHCMGRFVLCRWAQYTGAEGSWPYVTNEVCTPTYGRQYWPWLHSGMEQMPVVIAKRDGAIVRMSIHTASAIVAARGWPTNANHLAVRV